MKFGFRTPNIKTSIKARTIGKVKRKAKKAINPLYGRKGMGYINNPKKALYNKVYNKTSFGIKDVLKNNSRNSSRNDSKNNNAFIKYNVKHEYKNYDIEDNKIYFSNKFYTKKQFKKLSIIYIVASLFIIVLGFIMLPIGIIFSLLGLIYFFIGIRGLKEIKKI